MHLLLQGGKNIAEQIFHIRLSRHLRDGRAAEIGGEEHLLQVVDDLDDHVAVGQTKLIAVHGDLGSLVVVGNLSCNGVQQAFLCHDGSLLKFFQFWNMGVDR